MIQSFAAGNLAMVLNTSALQSSLIAASTGHFTLKDAPMPGFGTTPPVPTNSGSALFMLSKSALKQEADWELIQYLTRPSSETTITENIGYPPLRPSIVSVPQYLLEWASQNPLLPANLFQLDHVKPWLAYPGPNYAAIDTVLLNAVSNVVFQSANPQQTMATAQSQATALLK
jgi:multiple sugar transport system substrate-binding protein